MLQEASSSHKSWILAEAGPPLVAAIGQPIFSLNLNLITETLFLSSRICISMENAKLSMRVFSVFSHTFLESKHKTIFIYT